MKGVEWESYNIKISMAGTYNQGKSSLICREVRD